LVRELVCFSQLLAGLTKVSTKESDSLCMFHSFYLGMACFDLLIAPTIYFSQKDFSLLSPQQISAHVNFQPFDLALH
jgi:hypothetical protein